LSCTLSQIVSSGSSSRFPLWVCLSLRSVAPRFCSVAPRFCSVAPRFCSVAPRFCSVAPQFTLCGASVYALWRLSSALWRLIFCSVAPHFCSVALRLRSDPCSGAARSKARPWQPSDRAVEQGAGQLEGNASQTTKRWIVTQ